jgi:hypothetical protein
MSALIGGLTHVGIVDGVDLIIGSRLEAQDHQGAVGDNFVGVHIDRCAGSALNGFNDKLVMPFALYDFPGSPGHSHGLAPLQDPRLHIGQGASLFYHGQGNNQLRVEPVTADRKVFLRPHTMKTIVSIAANDPLTKRVLLYSSSSRCFRQHFIPLPGLHSYCS